MLRLFLLKPKILFVAQVDLHGQQPVYPQLEVDFKNVTVGHYSVVMPGHTVFFGTAPGKDDLGRNRIRRFEEEYPTFRLQVGRFSLGHNDGEVELIENSYITVLDDFRVWAKIPRLIGAVIRKDGDIPAFGYVDKPRPVASGGPGVAGDIDESGYFTVTFSGNNSFQFVDSGSPPVGGITNYSYDPKDGSVVSGSLTAQVVTVRFPPGFRYVRLRVTGDNGEQHDTWIPVFARDPNNDESIQAFQVRSHLHTREGQEVSVEFYQPIPRDEYPDGTLMMLWDDEIAYTPTSAASRQHMQFIGWHQHDAAGLRAERTATLPSTTLTFLDVCKRLATLPGFSQVQEYNAVPTTWMQTKHPNMLYFFWYLLYWHSTALEVASLILGTAQATLAMYEFVALGSDRATLYAQVNSLAQMITPDHRLTCGRQGQLRVVVDPQIQNVPDRTGTDWMNLDENDYTDVQYSYIRPPRVQQIRTKAIKVGRDYVIVNGKPTIPIIASIAPGEAHGQGESELVVGERIALDEYRLNTTEGNRYAYLNARYGRFAISLPFERLTAVFDLSVPFWTRLSLADDLLSARELPINFNDQRGLVLEMNIQYDYADTGLVRTVSLQWEMETSGPPAQTVILWPPAPDPTFLATLAVSEG